MENKGPTCHVFIGTSLDNFIADPEGGFAWLENSSDGSEGDFGFADFMAEIDCMVMGRKTYDVVAGMVDRPWAYAGKRVVVLTSRTTDTTDERVEFCEEKSMARLVERLGKEGVRRVYVDGGEVIRAFLREDLVDTMHITRVPVLLGAGVPLFAADEKSLPSGEKQWKLVSSQVSAKFGIVSCKYARNME
ncbi:Dihydrofolate reductase [Balamuthia mandrillaris]